MHVSRFAADAPGYGSGWKAFHNHERYTEKDLARLCADGERNFTLGYRAAVEGRDLYDEMWYARAAVCW